MTQKIFCKISAITIVFSICFSILGFSTSGVEFSFDEGKRNGAKSDFNYVALGASNMVGYGLHGYNFEYVYEAPFEKEKDNLYGYEMDTQGSYTMLISEFLSKDHNVNLYQLGMSSLRIEELHFLLDETYKGDSYTDAWFYDINGDGVSANWYHGAATYEWSLLAQNDVAGYDNDPTPEELLKSLRKSVQNKVANADLITLDLGMNNFGTYMLNLLANDIFSDDLNDISPEFAEFYTIAKDYVMDVIETYIGDNVISTGMLSQFADTLAYALVGYCINFDESLKEIYALNSDVDLVVVSIQNMMKGLEIVFPGSNVKIPFGDIFGVIVNAANFYTAILSPYASKYFYANVSENGHPEFFFDEIASYNGNPSSLSLNMKDCFDVYDGTLYLKTRIQQMFAVEMSEKGLVNMDASQGNVSDINSLKAFHYGYHYGIKEASEYPVITWKDATPLKDFIKNGEAGKLTGEDKNAYNLYVKMLSVAYDVTGEIFREGTKPKIIDFTMLGMASVLGVDTYAIVLGEINSAIEKVIMNSNYEFDMENEYPDGFFNALSYKNNISTDVYNTAFTTALFMQFGGTVFSHPNANGYKTIANKIWEAYTNNITGFDIFVDYMSVEYKPTDESYFVAVCDENVDYAEIFAGYLGLSKNQFGTSRFDNIDYEQIDKADLISIGFDESSTLEFLTHQLGGYLAVYCDNNVRTTINSTISSMFDELSTQNFVFQIVAGGLKSTFLEKSNSTIDEMLVTYGLADKKPQELDWTEILDDEQIVYVDTIKSYAREYLIQALESESYIVEIDMVEWIAENAGTLAAGNPAETFLSNEKFLRGFFGESAVLTIEIPIVDALTFVVESYLYDYVKFTLQSANLISYINQNNPNAKIMILGHFNPLNNVCLEFGSQKIELGTMYESVSMISTVRQFAQFCLSKNSAFVYLQDVKTNYEASFDGEDHCVDILSFLMICLNDTDKFKISAEGDEKIAQTMLQYINSDCIHEYQDCADRYCNNCGEVRDTLGHTFSAWKVTVEATKDAEGKKIRTCYDCGFEEKEDIPVIEDDHQSNIDNEIFDDHDDPEDPIYYISVKPYLTIIVLIVGVGVVSLIVWFVREQKKSNKD